MKYTCGCICHDLQLGCGAPLDDHGACCNIPVDTKLAEAVGTPPPTRRERHSPNHGLEYQTLMTNYSVAPMSDGRKIFYIDLTPDKAAEIVKELEAWQGKIINCSMGVEPMCVDSPGISGLPGPKGPKGLPLVHIAKAEGDTSLITVCGTKYADVYLNDERIEGNRKVDLDRPDLCEVCKLTVRLDRGYGKTMSRK